MAFKEFCHKNVELILVASLSLGVFVLSYNNFFFWDTISQVSIPATWYFDNNFRTLFVPDDIATGHPPLIPLYLAMFWKISERSLFASHLSMLPFVFGILYQILLFLKRSELNLSLRMLVLIFVYLDATILSQMSMVTFDIPQIFFLMWGINSLQSSKYLQLSLSFTLLVLTSLRGTIAGSGLIIFVLADAILNKKKPQVKQFIAFFPGVLVFLGFLTLFYFKKGWIIHNVVSGRWAESAQIASLEEMLINSGVVIWRLIDFGRVPIWIIFMFCLYEILIKGKEFDRFLKTSVTITLAQLALILPLVIIYRNSFGHRYFLPVIIFASITSVYWIIKFSVKRKIILSATFILIVSGYFWIYPLKIANGWDSTPGHWSYYKLRRDMIEYLGYSQIKVDSVGSFFPNLASFRNTDLSDDESRFREADISTDKYILFSNVYNVSDEVIESLFESGNWIVEKKLSKGKVDLFLFKRMPS